MINLNTNLSSQIVQQSMSNATKLLNLSVEQMTTGYKLNHAKDNAANYSISTNLTTKIGAYQVAEENVLQGLDMIRTTSESLETMGESLSRLRALAVQAQNGTFGDKSLSAITAEATALINELYRTKSTTEYSGTKLFGSGTDGITNAGKELKLNEQGFLQKVNVRDTSTMAKLKDVDPATTISSGTYSITTAEELQKLSDMSRAGLITGGEFVLGANIDLKDLPDTQTGEGWKPIKGGVWTFDGNSYSIENLYINAPTKDYQGLFSGGSSSFLIKNLCLKNVDVTARDNSAVLSGSTANIKNCSIIGGQLIGRNNIGSHLGSGYYAQTGYCYSNIKIMGNSDIGGIAGYNNYSTTYNSFFSGSIWGNNAVGGIVGFGDDCYNVSSSAEVSGVSNVGGITGGANRNVTGSYFSGTVSGDKNIGGIAGYASQYSSKISDCIIDGKVQGNTNAGVFLGSNTGNKTIKDSYYDGGACSGLLPFGGGGDPVVLTNLTDVSMGTTHMLQVGTNGNWASNLSFNTYISLPGIDKLLDNGITNPDLIANIDECIDVVARKNTEVGAAENRLLSVLDEIEIQYNNLVSSRSTIMDADISEVSSTYIQQQILQEASATLLATANQTPSIALGLI